MKEHRVYIDESGDHTYRHLDDLDRRYLGLTGIVVAKDLYNPKVADTLEELKKRFFSYDPDDPPILTRGRLIRRKRWFWPLRDQDINRAWEQALLDFYTSLQAQFFTVVIDKKEHFERYGRSAWNPYDYSLAVLLNRIRGWLNIHSGVADIMPESRGQTEDNQLLAAYVELRSVGSYYGTASQYSKAFPEPGLLFRRKDQNIAGLQLADLIAAEQKLLTLQERDRPMPHGIGPFGQRLNKAIQWKVNQYGRYLLE